MRRPPKKWFYHSIRAVKKYNRSIKNPEALVAWIWYHHTKPATKREILKKAEIAEYLKAYNKSNMKKAPKRKAKRRVKVAVIRKHTKANHKKKRIHIKAKKVRVSGMARKKRHHKRLHGLEGRRSMSRRQVIIMGGRRHRRHSRRGLLMGGDGIMQRMGNNALNVAAGVAGGVGGAFVSNLIPAPAKIKALLPVIGGIALASATRIPAIKFAGIGLSIIGGLSLVKQFMPGVPVLAGESVILIPDGSAPGLTDRSGMGDPSDLSRVPEPMGWATTDNG